jgi:hypothetical protein
MVEIESTDSHRDSHSDSDSNDIIEIGSSDASASHLTSFPNSHDRGEDDCSSSGSESDDSRAVIDSQEDSSEDSLDNDIDKDDSSESTRSNGDSGAAIMSNFGKENIGIEEGVAFSSASSLFFSNIAKGNLNPGISLDAHRPDHPSTTANALHKRDHDLKNSKKFHHSRSEAIVNPYKRTSAVNPYKKNKSKPRSLTSAAVNPYKIVSSSQSHMVRSPVPSSANSRVAKSYSKLPASRSMDLSVSASMGGADIDLGGKPKSTPTITRIATSIPDRPSGKKLEQRSPVIDPSLYKPPLFQKKSDPIVHNMTVHTCPKRSRQMIAVNQVFSSPVSKLWTSKFRSFNHMQSELTNTMAHSDDNVVVSAPTGGGKTAIFEMAMGRLFSGYCLNQGSKIPKSRKIVYISPSKALCEERYNDWKIRLAQIDTSIQCTVVTGDAVGRTSFREIDDAHLILTTPEKWDAITRKWTDHLGLIGAVKLLLIDEIHLIGDDSRGGCLEAVITRMKTVQRAAKAKYNMLKR